jgi:vitamin B12 transporter
MQNFYKLILIFLTLIFTNKLYANDIPILVISPSKTLQSASNVGTSLTVLNEKDLENSNRSFLGESLDSLTTGLNFFQTGGAGSQMGIQLRGLPKAYSTVYVDGVKKSDATTPKNDFYFDDILTGQVSRVEILKGNQSSMYGSGAMGGAINIFSKKGKGDFKKDYSYNTGSNKTHNLNLSYGGSDNRKDFYVGLERFQTDGISSMTHNDENDEYKNHTFLTNYGYKISDQLDYRAIFKFTDSKLHYDAINESFNQIDNKSHEKDSSATIQVDYRPINNFESNLVVGSGYMSRTADNIESQFSNSVVEQEVWTYRNTVSLNNNYKISSKHNIAFGLEKEFEEMRYAMDENTSEDFRKGEDITSQYIDIQSKLTKNLYSTIGVRFDQHSQDLDEDSERLSFAYFSDSMEATFKSSYGTGIKFPSLYEFYKSVDPDSLVAEKGRSFDFGVQKNFINKGLDFDLTFFNHKYEDTIEGWKSASWTPKNRPGVVRTRGLELLSKFIPKKDLDFKLGYTYNSTYDGADFDDPDLGPGSAGDFLNSQIVRVPRHLINVSANYNITDTTILGWKTKWSDTARDYGNINNAGGNFRDIRLDSYAVHDISLDFLYGKYKAYVNLTNILDEKYSQAVQFSTPERAFNFGLKKLY